MMDSGFKHDPPKWASHKQDGFTLIELMIVVGIIGILVSIAGPMYTRYQAKARQSEAKLALGAIYSLENSFYTEYGAYIADFDAIGYSPVGSKRFYSLGWAAVSNAGTVSGYAGSPGNFFYDRINYPATWTNCVGNDSTALGGWSTYTAPTATETDPQGFTVWAVGQTRPQVGSSNMCDIWSINASKFLSDAPNGIGY